MKKRMMAVLLATALTATMVGCGSKTEAPAVAENNGSVEAAESSEPIELTFPHIYLGTGNQAKWINWIADEVKTRSDGAVVIKVYSDSQLGAETETCPQVVAGDIAFGLAEGSVWGDVLNIPALGVYGLPYLCSSYEGMKTIGLDIMPDTFNAMLEDAGADLIAIAPISQGLRCVATVDKPVYTAEDLVGQKLRVPDATLYVDTLKAMGATPTPIAWSETYTAMSQGVVNGLENDPDTICSANMHEVLKYYTTTNHLAAFNMICMNKTTFESLPEEYQTLLLDVIKEGCAQQFDDLEQANKELLTKMEDAGVEIIEMDSAEIDKLKENVQPLWDTYINNYGVGDLIDQMVDAVK